MRINNNKKNNNNGSNSNNNNVCSFVVFLDALYMFPMLSGLWLLCQYINDEELLLLLLLLLLLQIKLVDFSCFLLFCTSVVGIL